MIFFCLATGLIALPWASAQQPVSAPVAVTPVTSSPEAASLVARNPFTKPNRPVSLPVPVNSPARQPDRTKVIRIYGGAGYFDVLLAEKLRSRLSKGFAASKSGLAKPAAGEIAAPAQPDVQRPIPVVSNL